MNWRSILIASAIGLSISANAATWSETTISYLRGSNFANSFEDNNRSELSFEHASGFKYGDNFFWLDVSDSQSSSRSTDTELYGEWSPRFSAGKVLGFYNKDRLVQDVLLSGTLEFGRSAVVSRARLYGFGLDFNIPHFSFFQYNLYIRDNMDKTGTTFQSTFAYKVPFSISKKIKINYSAYVDIVHGEEGTDSDSTIVEAYWHTGQVVTLDLGALWGVDNVIHTGFKYQYWNRKYGAKSGPVENNLKWMIKWVL